MFTVKQTLERKGDVLQTSSYANVTGTVEYRSYQTYDQPILNLLECLLAYKASGRRLGHKR